MFEKFRNISSDTILIDPNLFGYFSKIGNGIPFFVNNDEIYLLTDNEISNYKLVGHKIFHIRTEKERIEEDLFLMKNYNQWIIEKTFPQDSFVRSILDFVLILSILQNASDIHFDPFEGGYYVKFRIDTMMNKIAKLDKTQGEAIIMCLKVISSLDISKKNFSQTSSFVRNFRSQNIDFRFSTHPTLYGERCVIRVLKQRGVRSLEDVFVSDYVLSVVRKIIDEPYGFVVFTGPTNSGKTTAIHSIIKQIADKNINVMSLEDPVEYRIPGVIQTNISENGMGFYDGVKSILRQDPGVIFIGEIRDEKTAQIAAQAAMLGHKVFTTLHAYSAKGAISRMIDMGISSKILAECVLAVFSQRLLRRFEKNEYKDLVIASDVVVFDEEIREKLRNNEVVNFENNLYKRATELVDKKITTIEEIDRVIGNCNW